jgi:hypothetical protein
MPGKSVAALGNESLDAMAYLASVTYPTLTANASSDTTVTLVGVQSLDCISWNMQAPPAHLTIDNIYVSAANVITIRWGTDATGISTGSVAVLFEIVRADGANLGTQGIPSALV